MSSGPILLKYDKAFQDLFTLGNGRAPDVLGVTSNETSPTALSADSPERPSSNSSDNGSDHSASFAAILLLTASQVLRAGYTVE